ncbi:MAG: serine hydrolase domain-containing protein [Pseudomonadota bacterium]|nr:serine hydrolase domain-containing protein [Pseudomonadota bacterium]
MNRPLLLLVALPTLGCTAPAQMKTAAAAEDPRFVELTEWTEAQMEEWQVPGVALAVVTDGGVRHLEGLGVRRWNMPDPVTPDSLFRLGSISKMFAGAVVAEEIAAGRLSLDAPAADVLGDLTFAEPQTLEGVTLLQLISHTSGIQSTGLPNTCDPDPDLLGAELAEMAPEWAFWSAPGELFHYANQGYSLVGLMAERSAGAPYTDLAQGMLDRAGMGTATYDWIEGFSGEHATGHTMDLAEGRPLAYRTFNERACVASYPSGGLMASAEDVAGLLEALIHEGDGWVSPAAWELMTTEGYGRTETSGYGFGLQTASYRDHVGYTHHGSVGGYFAMVWAIPSEGLGVGVLVNSDHYAVDPPVPWAKPTQRIMEHALDTFLGLEPEERVSSARPVEDWDRYVGSYHSDYELGDVEITLEDGVLWYEDATTRTPMFTYSRDSFLYGEPRDDGRTRYVGVGFEEDATGALDWLITDTGIARRQPAL